MRKRILAIFLCLILTLSLAAAVAAEDFTVTLPPESNFLPPNRPEQPEPDDDDRTVTLQIPIIKIVELGGNTAPKQTTFSFYAFPSDPSFGRYESGGTGLGLSIARELVLRHNGTIALAPHEGPGTTIRLTLPIAGPASV